jgi:hypothetical protein
VSCHGDPEVTHLLEEDTEFRVEVTATVCDPADACMDVIAVELASWSQIGERTIDASADHRSGAAAGLCSGQTVVAVCVE